MQPFCQSAYKGALPSLLSFRVGCESQVVWVVYLANHTGLLHQIFAALLSGTQACLIICSCAETCEEAEVYVVPCLTQILICTHAVESYRDEPSDWLCSCHRVACDVERGGIARSFGSPQGTYPPWSGYCYPMAATYNSTRPFHMGTELQWAVHCNGLCWGVWGACCSATDCTRPSGIC